MRDIWKLFVGQQLARLIDKALLVVIIWDLLNSGSTHQLAVILAIGLLPHVILAPLTAKLINKKSALSILRIADGVKFILYALIFLILRRKEFDNLVEIFSIIIFIVNIPSALSNSSIFSLPSQIAEKNLQKIIALLDASFSVANIIGPLLAVFLYKFGSIKWMFSIGAITYFIVFMLDCLIKVKPFYYGEIQHDSCFKVIKENHLSIFIIMLAFFMNLVFSPIQIFIPLYAKNIYEHGLIGLSLLETSIGLGAVMGAFFLTILTFNYSHVTRLLISYFSSALAYLFFSISTGLTLGCISLFILGFFISVGNISALNFLQVYSQRVHVPFLMSLVNATSQIASPISLLLVSVVIESFTFNKVALGYSIIMILLSFVQIIPNNLRGLRFKEC